MTVRADLHIHSCLSPCGDLSMSPRAIAAAAVGAGLTLVALTDHNSARNVRPFADACREAGISALFGCEVTSLEEAHVLVLFESPDAAGEFAEAMYETLPDAPPFADQVVVDTDEYIVELLPRSLAGATSLSIADIGRRAQGMGGLFIPAHIDRATFSVWSQLGFLPRDSYDAVEMVAAHSRERIDPGRYPVIASSDAHYPHDVGARWTEFAADGPSLGSLRDALVAGRVKPRRRA